MLKVLLQFDNKKRVEFLELVVVIPAGVVDNFLHIEVELVRSHLSDLEVSVLVLGRHKFEDFFCQQRKAPVHDREGEVGVLLDYYALVSQQNVHQIAQILEVLVEGFFGESPEQQLEVAHCDEAMLGGIVLFVVHFEDEKRQHLLRVVDKKLAQEEVDVLSLLHVLVVKENRFDDHLPS